MLLFLASCFNIKSMIHDESYDYEVSKYNLENVDTLVNIGCRNAFYDGLISSKFQNLHFILEDLPKDELSGRNIKKILAKEVNNSQYEPTFGTNSKVVFGTPDTIPLQSGQYQRVLCRLSFHEFSNRKKMVSELTRILSPTGTLIIVENTSCYLGESKKHCILHTIAKEEVINSFSNLELVDTIPLKVSPLFLFKFKKKNNS